MPSRLILSLLSLSSLKHQGEGSAALHYDACTVVFLSVKLAKVIFLISVSLSKVRKGEINHTATIIFLCEELFVCFNMHINYTSVFKNNKKLKTLL